MLRRGLHLRHVLGESLRAVLADREAHRPVIDSYLIPHFPTQQLVDRQPGGLPGDVPQGHLNRADGAAPGLEGPHTANPLEHPLDIGRVLAQDGVAVHQHLRLDIGLVTLDLAEAVNVCVGGHTHHRVPVDQGAFQIGNFHKRSFSRRHIRIIEDTLRHTRARHVVPLRKGVTFVGAQHRCALAQEFGCLTEGIVDLISVSARASRPFQGRSRF